MKRHLIAALLLLLPPSAAAQEQDDILDRIINNPAPQSLRIDGLKSPPRPRNDDGVPGGKMLRIESPGRSEQTWSIAAASPIEKAVRAGDSLVLAFWARLAAGDDGAIEAVLPYNTVQLAAAPYTPVFVGPVTVGRDWAIHEVKGRADRDYAAGELNVSIHLASGRHTIDLGPVFVVNMGEGGS